MTSSRERASNKDWFDKNKLIALLAEIEAIIASAKAQGAKDVPAAEGVRDHLAGRLAVLQGDPEGAENKFRTSIDEFRSMQMSKELATVATEAAEAMHSAHRIDSALEFADEAIDAAELVWFGLPPNQRANPPSIIVDAAGTGVPIALEAYADEKAFYFVQSAKDRWVQEQIWVHEFATLPISAAFPDPNGPSPEFDAAIQQLDAAWNAYFSGDVVDQRHAAETRVVSAYVAEMGRPRRLRPSMISTADPARCQSLLAEDEALLDLYVTVPETFAALLTQHKLHMIPLGLSAEKLRARVHAGYVVLSLGRPGRPLRIEEIYERTRSVEWEKTLGAFAGQVYTDPTDFLREMYGIFLAPFARELASVRRLIVCPHWLLHSLPFHAFESSEGTPLVETTAVTYMPSVSAWEALRRSTKKPVPTSGKAAVLGVERRQAPMQATWFSRQLGRAESLEMPSVFEEEARTVAATYGVEPLVGQAAKKAKLIEAFLTAELIHISCHAVHDRPEMLTDGLLLADGLLSVAEVAASPHLFPRPGAEVRLSAIVLSACTSGQPQVESGDRLVSLGHGLVAKLGCSVISSLWRAHAESTSFLMARLHEHRKTVPDWAGAMRLAQLDMLAKGKSASVGPVVDFGHPYHWANFFVLGA